MKGQLYRSGGWHDALDGASFAVHNPANGAQVGQAARATVRDVELALDAAEAAFAGWAARPAKERAAFLHKIRQGILDRKEQLARQITQEEGKPLSEALGEVYYTANFFEFFAEETVRQLGEILPSPQADRELWVLKQPIGITVAITPWNYPMAMIGRKLAPALGAGCPVIVKPAEETPGCAAMLFEVMHDVGLPPGVVGLLTGEPELIGERLLRDPRVRKITFTGSTAVGKLIMRQAAENIASVSLELGGNAPFIVFDDADLDVAVRGIMSCKFRNAGEICVAANRFLVQDGIYDALVERLTDETVKMRAGDGLTEGVTLGPLINAQGLEKVEAHVSDALAHGARVVSGGRRLVEDGLSQGAFYAPTVLTDVTSEMRVWHEETFGPIAPLTRFHTEEEAFALANDTVFGLAAYAFTKDLGRALRAQQNLEFGMVGINDPVPSLAQVPIGGMKQSGIGREGGRQGIEDFLELKYVSVRF